MSVIVATDEALQEQRKSLLEQVREVRQGTDTELGEVTARMQMAQKLLNEAVAALEEEVRLRLERNGAQKMNAGRFVFKKEPGRDYVKWDDEKIEQALKVAVAVGAEEEFHDAFPVVYKPNAFHIKKLLKHGDAMRSAVDRARQVTTGAPKIIVEERDVSQYARPVDGRDVVSPALGGLLGRNEDDTT